MLLGGRALVLPGTSQFSNVSEFHQALADVDIIIDETYLPGSYEELLNLYHLTPTSPFKFITNNQVYRVDGLLNPGDGQGASWDIRSVGPSRSTDG